MGYDGTIKPTSYYQAHVGVGGDDAGYKRTRPRNAPETGLYYTVKLIHQIMVEIRVVTTNRARSKAKKERIG